MFSKVLKITYSVFLVFALSACTSKDKPVLINEDPLLPNLDSCVAKAGENLKAYMNQEITSKDLDEFWSCNQSVLNKITIYVEGKEKGVYSAKELHSLIKYLIFKDKPLRKEFTEEILHLKVALVGGDPERLTHFEIRSLKKLLVTVKTVSFILKPYIKETLERFKNTGKPYKIDKNKIIYSLKESINILGDHLARSAGSYKIEDLGNLVNEFSQLSSKPKDFRLWAQLIGQIKSLLVTPGTKSISRTDWRRIVNLASAGVESWVIYSEREDGEAFTSNKSLEIMDQISTITSLAFKDSLNSRSDKRIYNEEIFDLLSTLTELKILDKKVPFNQPVLEAAWTLTTHKFLNRDKAQKKKDFLFVTDIDFVYNEYRNWSQAQKWINSNSELPLCQKSKRLKTSENPVLELSQLARCGPWDIKVNNGVMQLSASNLETPVNKESLSQINWIRAALRQIVGSYGSGKNLDEKMKAGLSIKEIKAIIADADPLMKALDLKINKGLHETLFTQSNIFLPSSDADKKLSPLEITQMVQYLSSGWRKSQEILGDKRSPIHICASDDMKKLSVDCVSNYFIKSNKQVFSNLPDFMKFMKRTTRYSALKLLKEMIDTVNLRNEDKSVIATEDLPKIFSLISFIETYMMRFDKDKNSFISQEEAMRSYSDVYKTISEEVILPRVSGLISDTYISSKKITRNFFEFLIQTGQLPVSIEGMGGSSSEASQFNILSFIGSKFKEVKGTRSTLSSAIKVLAYASDQKQRSIEAATEKETLAPILH